MRRGQAREDHLRSCCGSDRIASSLRLFLGGMTQACVVASCNRDAARRAYGAFVVRSGLAARTVPGGPKEDEKRHYLGRRIGRYYVEPLLFGRAEIAMLRFSAMSSSSLPGRNSHQAGSVGVIGPRLLVLGKARGAPPPGQYASSREEWNSPLAAP